MKGGQITPFGGSRHRIKGGQITPFGGGSGSCTSQSMYGGGKPLPLNPEAFAHEGMHAKPESMVVAAPQKGGHRCKRGGSKRRGSKRRSAKRSGSKRSGSKRSGSKRKTRKY